MKEKKERITCEESAHNQGLRRFWIKENDTWLAMLERGSICLFAANPRASDSRLAKLMLKALLMQSTRASKTESWAPKID